MDGFDIDQRLRLYINREFGFFHRLFAKAAENQEQKGIFHILDCTSFIFIEGCLADTSTMEIDWSVAHGLDRVFFVWDAREVHLIDAHE